MMILLKHFITEQAINVLFEKIELNFSTTSPMPRKGDIINILFNINGIKLYIPNTNVSKVLDTGIIILYIETSKVLSSGGPLREQKYKMKYIGNEDIIKWKLTPYINSSI